MIEVFKTDVEDKEQAAMLLGEIHSAFAGVVANFDLQDCDKILRVNCKHGDVLSYPIISLMKSLGCQAEVLPDDDQPFDDLAWSKANESLTNADK